MVFYIRIGSISRLARTALPTTNRTGARMMGRRRSGWIVGHSENGRRRLPLYEMAP